MPNQRISEGLYMTGLSCGLGLQITIETSLTLTQQIAAVAETLRGKLGHSAAEGLKCMLDVLSKSLKGNERIIDEIKKIISDPFFQELLIQHAGEVVQENPDWRDFAASYCYSTDCIRNGGNFTVQKRQADGSYLTQDIPLDEGLFKQAVLRPEELQKEIGRLNEAILSSQGNREPSAADATYNLTRERQKQVDALDIADAYTQRIQEILKIVSGVLLVKPKKNQRNVLIDFLYDTHVLSKLDFYVSERLIKRFCTRFENIKSTSTITDADKKAASNIAAEFVLVSLGIINPEIFYLQKGEISSEETAVFKGFCHELNIDPNTLAKHYQIQTSGTFFWNRYFVQGMKPSKITEQKIRNFITNTFRQNPDEILAAMQFETGFEAIQQQLRELGKKPKKAELESILNEALLRMLEQEAFQDLVVQKATSQEWKNALALFYQ